MYDNKMVHISAEEANKRILELKKDKDIFTVVLDGKEISNWKEYINIVRKTYKFPTIEDNYDGYRDWMEDLSWLNKNGYALFIHNFSKFLSGEPKTKEIVMDLFENYILLWWAEEADLYWYKGATKPFNIYLID